MTQFFPPAVNVGDSQSLNLEASANSEATSLTADDTNTAPEAVWSGLDLECGFWPTYCRGLWMSYSELPSSVV